MEKANKTHKLVSVCAAVAGAAGLLTSPLLLEPAQACGGFWCSQANPVDQSAEQIIFIDNPDDTITAIIQISYVGPSEKFAWVLPMPGTPKPSVSSNQAFVALQGATAPQYTLTVEVEGTCKDGNFIGGFPTEFDGAAQDAGAAPAPDGGGVTVQDSGSVGPYDYVTISVDGSSDVAKIALDWLTDNGYDLTGTDADVLEPYLADGLNLMAFRLTKGNSAGSIRPVMLTYDSELPMIPIRPTAVAAQNDMGIRVWVAAGEQAVPKNYKSLVLNEALIDWFCASCSYDKVVTAAADEAQGQGFVTELAAPMTAYSEVIWSTQQESDWMSYSLQSFPDGIDAIWEANWRYRGWDGWRDAIEAAVVLPAGATYDEFGMNPDAFRGTAQVDVSGFKRELYERVVKPVIDTQELLVSQPYLTRLYSTMSAEEMTVDPAFTYNGDLADVSNVHTAMQFIECSADISYWEAPWRIELPQGGVIRGEGTGNWPLTVEDGALPANLRIVQLSESGAGKVVVDNSGMVSDALFDMSGTMGSGEAIPDPPEDGVPIGGVMGMGTSGDEDPAAKDSGCAVGGTPGRSAAAGLWALAVGIAFVLRRRRTRAR